MAPFSYLSELIPSISQRPESILPGAQELTRETLCSLGPRLCRGKAS